MRATYLTHFTISSLLVKNRSYEARNSLLVQIHRRCSILDLSLNHFMSLQILTLQFLSVRALRFSQRCCWRSKCYGLWRRADRSVVTGVSECLPDCRYGDIAFIPKRHWLFASRHGVTTVKTGSVVVLVLWVACF